MGFLIVGFTIKTTVKNPNDYKMLTLGQHWALFPGMMLTARPCIHVHWLLIGTVVHFLQHQSNQANRDVLLNKVRHSLLNGSLCYNSTY